MVSNRDADLADDHHQHDDKPPPASSSWPVPPAGTDQQLVEHSYNDADGGDLEYKIMFIFSLRSFFTYSVLPGTPPGSQQQQRGSPAQREAQRPVQPALLGSLRSGSIQSGFQLCLGVGQPFPPPARDSRPAPPARRAAARALPPRHARNLPFSAAKRIVQLCLKAAAGGEIGKIKRQRRQPGILLCRSEDFLRSAAAEMKVVPHCAQKAQISASTCTRGAWRRCRASPWLRP